MLAGYAYSRRLTWRPFWFGPEGHWYTALGQWKPKVVLPLCFDVFRVTQQWCVHYSTIYIYICDLLNDAISFSDYMTSDTMISEWWIGKWCGWKSSWPNTRSYRGIPLGLRRNTESFSQDSHRPGPNSNNWLKWMHGRQLSSWWWVLHSTVWKRRCERPT